MQVLDASSIIYAWDNYPLRQFPPLWKWIASQINANTLVISKVAHDEEVRPKVPELAKWLEEKGIERLKVTDEIIQEAVRIKSALGIEDDKYHSSGVGENDILIIATARVHGLELISDEARQVILPKSKAKMKIPAVCDLDEVDVQCLSFLELIKRSDVVFG